MKHFQALLVLAASASSSATSPAVQQRDLDRATAIMTPVLQGLANFDSSLQCFSGGDAAPLFSAGNVLVASVQAASDQAVDMPPMSIEHAKSFQPISVMLNKYGDAVLVDLAAKQAAFEQAHVCGTIGPFVGKLGHAVDDLMKIFAEKFPADGQSQDSIIIARYRDGFTRVHTLLAGCVDGAKRSHRARAVYVNATACNMPMLPIVLPTLAPVAPADAQPAFALPAKPLVVLPAPVNAKPDDTQPTMQAPAPAAEPTVQPSAGMRNATQPIVTAAAQSRRGSGIRLASGALAVAFVAASFL